MNKMITTNEIIFGIVSIIYVIVVITSSIKLIEKIENKCNYIIVIED